MLWTVVNLSTWKMDQKVIKRQSGHTYAMNHPTPWSYTLDNNFQIILDQIYYHLLSKICNANLLVLECHVLFSLQNPHLIIHITQRLPFKYIYLHYLHQKSNNCSSPVSFRYKKHQLGHLFLLYWWSWKSDLLMYRLYYTLHCWYYQQGSAHLGVCGVPSDV